jgi:uncharacterized membrane protein
MDIGQVLYDFFGKRIAEYGTYGIVEYIVYGAIMLALAFFAIFPALDKRGIRFNAKFMLSLLPYILLGSAVHVLEDMRLLQRSWNPLELGYYFVTPGIYLLVAAVTLFCLFVSLQISKKAKKDFHIIFAAIGVILAVPVAVFELINFKAWLGFFGVIALVLAIVAILLLLRKKFKFALLQDRLNILAIASQAVDGSATYIAVNLFKCGEQHPLSEFFLKTMPKIIATALFPDGGPLADIFTKILSFSFVVIKVLLAIVILHYIDKEIKRENLRGFIKIVIAILGFATGLRDLLTLGVGTCL